MKIQKINSNPFNFNVNSKNKKQAVSSNGFDNFAFTGVPVRASGLFDGLINLFTKMRHGSDEFSYENIIKAFRSKGIKPSYDWDVRGKMIMEVNWLKNTSNSGVKNDILNGEIHNGVSQFEFSPNGKPLKFSHISNSNIKVFTFDKLTGLPLTCKEIKPKTKN